jgi:hypothetical protein
MKRKLLFASVLLSGISFGQFTQTNEPAVGALVDYFLCDSNVTNYDNVTGIGVTWNYSNIAGVTGVQKLSTVIDASTSPNASDFPGATKATSIATAITTFFTSDATSRTSQGFVYNEPTFGEVKAKWTTDQQITHNYPMGLGNTVNDNFAGVLSFSFQGVPQSPASTGVSYALVDGEGTLELAGNSYSNVLRYKLVDTAYTSVIILGDLQVIRTQYEYYQLANFSLPLFTHTTIKIQAPGATEPLTAQTLVLSKDEPTGWLGLNEENLSGITVYPNPATSTLTISGIEDQTNASIHDQSGRIIRTLDNLCNGMNINIEDLDAGVYYVQFSNAGIYSVKQIVKK